MKESHSSHTLSLIALALGAVAVIVVGMVVTVLYMFRWVGSQPMAWNNPTFTAMIVFVVLVVGIVLTGGLLILHDAVDAWGDAYKTNAANRDLTHADIERAAALAKVRRDHAAAAKDERDGAPALPPWQDDAVPWPVAENVNGHAGPKEFGG